MRKSLLFAIALLAFAVVGRAQYQLPNPGFEQWDGTSITAEPTHWNSFATSDGSFASLASSPHHYHRNGGRPGAAGSSYLTIYSTSIFGIVANGNMTTGRVHAGGMSASSSENYNYTQRDNSSHCQPFTGTPDSMYVWVSYYAASASSQGQVKAIIHGNNNFRAPNDENNPALYCGTAAANFTRTTSSASSMQWQQVKVPFSYNGISTANYILINITTNGVAGSGSANDSLSIDDIEFIYSAWLTDITLNGTTVDGFNRGVLDYEVVLADTAALSAAVVAVQTQAADATPAVATSRLTDSTAQVTITVTAEDGVTVKVYHVNLSAPMPEPIPGPVADTVRYTVAVQCDTTMGSVSPAGETVVDSADMFTVTATAAEGYHFVGWSVVPGYANIVTNNPFTFAVTSDVTVTAHFEADSVGGDDTVWYTVTVLCNDSTMGSVTGSGRYMANSVVTIEAVPTGMYVFEWWNDNVEDNPRTFVVTSDTTFTAIFHVHGGIDDRNVPSVAVYPNPATDHLTVEAEGRVTLSDISGRELMAAEGPVVFDVKALPAGVYLLQCNGAVRRIVKQ